MVDESMCEIEYGQKETKIKSKTQIYLEIFIEYVIYKKILLLIKKDN